MFLSELNYQFLLELKHFILTNPIDLEKPCNNIECVLGENKLSNALYSYLEPIGHYPVLLRPQKKKPKNMITGNKWKIVPNVEIEADI